MSKSASLACPNHCIRSKSCSQSVAKRFLRFSGGLVAVGAPSHRLRGIGKPLANNAAAYCLPPTHLGVGILICDFSKLNSPAHWYLCLRFTRCRHRADRNLIKRWARLVLQTTKDRYSDSVEKWKAKKRFPLFHTRDFDGADLLPAVLHEQSLVQ
jgi:hypothetical protein